VRWRDAGLAPAVTERAAAEASRAHGLFRGPPDGLAGTGAPAERQGTLWPMRARSLDRRYRL